MNKLLILSGILVPLAVLIALAGLYYRIEFSIENFESEEGTSLEEEIKRVFLVADEDQSGSLNLEEFQAAVRKVLKVGLVDGKDVATVENQLKNDAIGYAILREKIESSLAPEHVPNEALPLTVKFQPFELNSLSKFKDGSYSDYNSQIHLTGLKAWKSPNVVQGILIAENFSVLLPPDTIGFEVGKPWHIVNDGGSSLDNDHYKYYPRKPETRAELLIITLLSMFHPRPFLNLRFGPRGAIGILRAYNSQLVDIVFRVHAEFQLNEPPRYPFWYTPAQFVGRIVMDKHAHSIQHFQFYLPKADKLNIDMEWITGQRRSSNPQDRWYMEVDIGYQPEMAIVSNGSVPVNSEYKPPVDIDKIRWTDEISVDEARSIIEKTFYPFKKVPYLKFNETFRAAPEQGKLIHSIVLWGTLDNQAC